MTVILWTFGLLLAIWIFFAPSYIARKRRHPSEWAITLVNLLFGLTGIGWVIALAWAFSDPVDRRRPPVLEWRPDETRRDYERRVAAARRG